MKVVLFALALQMALAANPSVCGSKPGVPDCNHKDMGSCGNACCVGELAFADTPEKTYNTVKDALQNLQQDGFSYVTGGDPNPEDDLRPFNITEPENFEFILQGRHDAPKYYGPNGDILDFAIYRSGTGSVVRMFSLSRIHGALGDNGQNAKTLLYLTDKMGKAGQLLFKHGCGQMQRTTTEVKVQAAEFPPTCGKDTKDPDCGMKDMGSCGNACCLAELPLSMASEQAYSKIKAALSNKSGFSYVTGGDPNPGDDLRPFNITEPENFEFILQGRHDAPKYYGPNGDILDFAIYRSGTGSVVRMFSLSRIHGALGDNGQNYKSLSLLAAALNNDASLTVRYGCGAVTSVLAV